MIKELKEELLRRYPVEKGPYPFLIPYHDVVALFPHLVGRPHNNPPIEILTDPEEIERCSEATRVKDFGMYVSHPFHMLITHPTLNKLTGKYGSQAQAVTRTEAYGGRVAIIIAPFFKKDDSIYTVLVRAYRPTLAYLPLEQGGGWELEIPSCGHRPEMELEQSVVEELEKESNFRATGTPIRLTQRPAIFVPGTMSEGFEVFAVPAEPLPGDPYEAKEGITKRMIVSIKTYRDLIAAGVYHTLEGSYNTGLAHNIIAAYFLTEAGYWPR